MKDIKIQWHPGFVAAMDLELRKSRDDLWFEKEYNLNTKPLEIDLLVIKKNRDAHIDNEIGRIFRGHNIMEYKSPEDHLDIDAFYKTTAYACLYKSSGKTVDFIKAEDVTVSLVREVKPEGLFQYFAEHHYSVSNPYCGIYYIAGEVLFPTQIVVTKELEWASHIWLGALSDRLEKQNVVELLENINQLSGKTDRELADSVLQVSVEANKQVVEELIGDGSMCEALMEIMEPQLLQREKEGLKEGLTQGIQGAVELLRDLGQEDAKIKANIVKEYGISPEEAEEYLQQK